MNKLYDILILGSGPAGIHAAAAGVQHGAAVALVDMAHSPGGRVLKTMEDGMVLGHTTIAESRSARRLASEFAQFSEKIDYFPGSTLVDLVDKQAIIDGAHGQRRLSGKAVILAPGALESPAVFENWTAPGIYTLGGYNTLLKRGRTQHHSVLVAGSGPLLYAVAANISKNGGRLAGLLDAASLGQNIELGMGLVFGGYYDKIRLASKAFVSLMGTRWKRRCRIASVSGEAGNFTVRTVFMDSAWKTTGPGPEFTVDAIAVSYGLHPNTDLSRRCECAHSYDPVYGVWNTLVDEFLRTSVPGIYAAGDGVEVKGYEGACIDGRLAGMAAVFDLGMARGCEAELRSLQKKRLKGRRFAALLAQSAEPGDGYFDELSDELVICRCEAVTMRDIRAARAEGARDRNGVKKRTRLGMGHCQGRYCGQLIDRILSRVAGAEHVPAQFGPRTPVMPVRIGILAGEEMPVSEEFRL